MVRGGDARDRGENDTQENMDIRKCKQHGEIKEYPIYTANEASEAGLKPVPWRLARTADFAWTDDGYATQCIEAKPCKRKKKVNWIIRFPFGYVWDRQKVLNYADYKNGTRASRHPRRDWAAKEATYTRTKRVVFAYVQQILKGKVDWDELGILYRPDQKIPRATVQRLFHNERIKKMVSEEMRRTLKATGITEEWVFETLKTATKMAIEQKKPEAIVTAAKEIAKLLEMYPKGSSNLQLTATYGVSAEIAEDMQKAQKELEEHGPIQDAEILDA